jgi:hypothetical protein
MILAFLKEMIEGRDTGFTVVYGAYTDKPIVKIDSRIDPWDVVLKSITARQKEELAKAEAEEHGPVKRNRAPVERLTFEAPPPPPKKKGKQTGASQHAPTDKSKRPHGERAASKGFSVRFVMHHSRLPQAKLTSAWCVLTGDR